MTCLLAVLLLSRLALAQSPAAASSDQFLAQGERLYQAQCAYCHGARGEGGRGASLARSRLRNAPDDESLSRVIARGIPGTGMPRSSLSPRQVTQVAAFVRGLGRIPREAVPGDPTRGARVYGAEGCAGCHTIRGRGGALGPDLDDIGARAGAGYLRASLVAPEGSVPDGFLEVRAVSRDGRTLTGVRLNEDSFSIQLRDAAGDVHSFWKSELRALDKRTGRSPMPSYRTKLTAADLDDLVAYLVSLEGRP